MYTIKCIVQKISYYPKYHRGELINLNAVIFTVISMKIPIK